MSIHWRDWKGLRISDKDSRTLAEWLALDVRKSGMAQAAHKVVGDTLFLAVPGPSNSVEVYEARIVRMGEEARYQNETRLPPGPEDYATRAEFEAGL